MILFVGYLLSFRLKIYLFLILLDMFQLVNWKKKVILIIYIFYLYIYIILHFFMHCVWLRLVKIKFTSINEFEILRYTFRVSLNLTKGRLQRKQTGLFYFIWSWTVLVSFLVKWCFYLYLSSDSYGQISWTHAFITSKFWTVFRMHCWTFLDLWGGCPIRSKSLLIYKS